MDVSDLQVLPATLLNCVQSSIIGLNLKCKGTCLHLASTQ